MRQERVWPKRRATLSDEQRGILSDWYQYWLSETGMQGRYGFIDRFGHEYAARSFASGCRTLEIGAGNGGHLRYESLGNQEYVALEQSESLSEEIRRQYPKVNVIIRDCQEGIEFQDHYFDRVLAIHVLEHLVDLPNTLKEVSRVLRPNGSFSVVIPCEGGWLYKQGRKRSSERMFVNRYHQSYEWLIRYDHVNTAREVFFELRRQFKIISTKYFPFWMPAIDLELVIGITCMPAKRGK